MEEIKTEKHLNEGKREKGMSIGKQEHIKTTFTKESRRTEISEAEIEFQ